MSQKSKKKTPVNRGSPTKKETKKPEKGKTAVPIKSSSKNKKGNFSPTQLLKSLLGRSSPKKTNEEGGIEKGRPSSRVTKQNKVAKPGNQKDLAQKLVTGSKDTKSSLKSNRSTVTSKDRNEAEKYQKEKETAKKHVMRPSSAKINKEKKAVQQTEEEELENPTGLESLLSKEAGEEEDQTLRDAQGRPYCKVKDCDQIAVVEGYCRYHYLLLWKKIQIRRKILADGKLERYIEELTSRYPDKYLDVIRKDLCNEKTFLSLIAEMEIDESSTDSDFEAEDTQSLDEVRGFTESQLVSEDEF
ncbi:MAG: hypothetical protein NZ480_02430 [Bdellovibrionaceae bacterium]|nr:hypothetical protein [Pseudobdellovibrionaceae bacterium]MDW8190242.1 hypothetical protein [Pseudobdellovibrionaceae bacterium]